MLEVKYAVQLQTYFSPPKHHNISPRQASHSSPEFSGYSINNQFYHIHLNNKASGQVARLINTQVHCADLMYLAGLIWNSDRQLKCCVKTRPVFSNKPASLAPSLCPCLSVTVAPEGHPKFIRNHAHQLDKIKMLLNPALQDLQETHCFTFSLSM